MGDRATGNGQSGGVNISGNVGTVSGDIVGRDKITDTLYTADLDAVLHPVAEAIGSAPVERRAEAEIKLAALKREAAKGNGADDSLVAKLVKGIAGLAPGAVSAVVGAFATPILGGLAGPVTKFVLDELRVGGE